MIFTRRVRNMDDLVQQLGYHERLYVVQGDVEANTEQLRNLGFSFPLVAGESLLPAPIFGRASKRNANGYDIVHRDRPKEIRTHQIQWTWTERHGPNSVERTELRDRPYYRYPRTHVAPFSVELQLFATRSGGLVVGAGPLNASNLTELSKLQNTIHMFVECFGSCAVVPEIADVRPTEQRRLNWAILPTGEWPWQRVEQEVRNVIGRAKPNEQPVLQARFDEIGAFRPTFSATGLGGFSRYIVHGWEPQQIYLLESLEVNNATYVLKENWEAISAMTKAEILQTEAHHARLIHRQQWFGELRDLMAQNGVERKDGGQAPF